MFVGREAELSELVGGLEDAIDGHGQGYLILGEPGIGKTRLAAEVADHAAGNGLLVLWGRCWEAGGAPPYWPWTEVLRGAEPRDAGVDAPGALVAVLPHQTVGRDSPAQDPTRARFQLFDAVGELLHRLGAAQPVLVVLDDLHAADLPSLLLLEHLLGGVLRRSRVVVVALSRERELLGNEEVRAAGLRVRRLARTVRLGGLARNDVARLVHDRVGAGSEEVVDPIAEATEGNPLFVEELVGLIQRRGGALQLSPLPIGIRETIRQRYDALPVGAAEMLSAGAVVGREFDLGLLAAVAGRQEAELVAAVDEAVRQGVLDPREPGRYRFSHILIRDVLYDELPATERASMHATVARALAARHASTLDDHLDEIAHHFVAALPAGEHDAAVAASVRAGSQAEDRLGYERAVAHYERALSISEAHAIGDGGARCDLLLALARAYERAGRTERSKEVLRRVAEVARRLDDPVRLAHAALGLSERVAFQQDDDGTVAILDEAIAAVPASAAPLRARLLAASARVLGYAGHRERMEVATAEALTAARDTSDPAVLAEALAARQVALWRPDRVVDRLELATEMLALAESSGDPEKALEGQMSRMICHLELGDGPEFDRALVAYARLADELRQPRYRFVAMTRTAMRHLMCGRFDDGRQLAEEARRFGAQSEEPDVDPVYHGVLALPAGDDGVRLDDVERFFVDFSSRHTSAGSRALLALFALARDDAAAARWHLDALLNSVELLPIDMDWLLCLAAGGACAHALADEAAAAVLYDRLAGFSDRCVLVAGAIGFAGSVAHYLGLLAATLGRDDEADEHFRVAAATHSALGADPWLARTLFEHGRTLGAAGGSLTARARELAEGLGMSGLLRQLSPTAPATPLQATPTAASLCRHGDAWVVRFGETSFTAADGKGLHHLSVLLARPGQEVHVLDLAGCGTRLGTGDAGPVLDAAAKSAYRQRVNDLREELAEAEAWNDESRAARVRLELDAVAHELAAAVGLHDRDRRAASTTDRARVSVRKAIVRALREIARNDPALGRYLETTIQTGVYCVYDPDPRFPVAWEL